MSIGTFFAVSAAQVVASGGGGEGGGEDPPGAPSGLTAVNDGVDYRLNWTNAQSQVTQIYRDGSLYDAVAADVAELVIGAMFNDGTHTWKVRHISPDTDFSAEITTVDGIVNGGGGPTAAPFNLGVYEYGGGTRYGIGWHSGDLSAETYLNGEIIEPGTAHRDQGLKSGAGTIVWTCYHIKNGVQSDAAPSITTIDGELV